MINLMVVGAILPLYHLNFWFRYSDTQRVSQWTITKEIVYSSAAVSVAVFCYAPIEALSLLINVTVTYVNEPTGTKN